MKFAYRLNPDGPGFLVSYKGTEPHLEPGVDFVLVRHLTPSEGSVRLWKTDGPTDAPTFHRREDAALAAFGEHILAPRIDKLQKSHHACPVYRCYRHLTPEVAEKVYEILVHRLAAPLSHQRDFVYEMTREKPTHEWRIQGALGFGGKFWNEDRGFRISCYSEDSTPWREYLMELAEAELDEVYKSVCQCEAA